MFHDYWKNNKLDEFRELLEIAGINPDKEIKEKIDKRVKWAKEVLEENVFYIVPDIRLENSKNEEDKIKLYSDRNEDPEEAVIKYLTEEDNELEEYSIVEIYRKNVSGFKCKFYRIGIYNIKNIAKNFISESIALMEVCHIITGYEFISETIKDTVSQLLRANKELHSIDLSDADLRGAKLIGAKLRGADLIGADFSDADLHDADLRDADWKGLVWKFNPPVVIGANFENAKINDREFVKYLRKNGAKNVPDPVED